MNKITATGIVALALQTDGPVLVVVERALLTTGTLNALIEAALSLGLEHAHVNRTNGGEEVRLEGGGRIRIACKVRPDERGVTAGAVYLDFAVTDADLERYAPVVATGGDIYPAMMAPATPSDALVLPLKREVWEWKQRAAEYMAVVERIREWHRQSTGELRDPDFSLSGVIDRLPADLLAEHDENLRVEEREKAAQIAESTPTPLGHVVHRITRDAIAARIREQGSRAFGATSRPIDPDCRADKHPACPGWTWDTEADTETPCACNCHANPEGPRA